MMKKDFMLILAIVAAILNGSCGTTGTKDVAQNNPIEPIDSTEVKWQKDSADYFGIVREFPALQRLDELQKSEFVPTLESELSDDKNSIYCVTLLFAWNKVKEYMKPPIKLVEPSASLRDLNNSKSYSNVLDSGEYEIEAHVSGDTLSVKAMFQKSLPFNHRLSNFANTGKLNFDGGNVAAFGVEGYGYLNDEKLVILYYENDDNFIIKLLTIYDDHEIVLFKTSETFVSLTEYLSELNKRIAMGEKARKDKNKQWRYSIGADDHVYIPKMKFNLEHNYLTIEGQEVVSFDNKFKIIKAYQRNAFFLHESGAGVDSEAEVSAEAASADFEEEVKPKKMKFDKTFFLMMKKTTSKFPYFAMRVVNSELMIVE